MPLLPDFLALVATRVPGVSTVIAQGVEAITPAAQTFLLAQLLLLNRYDCRDLIKPACELKQLVSRFFRAVDTPPLQHPSPIVPQYFELLAGQPIEFNTEFIESKCVFADNFPKSSAKRKDALDLITRQLMDMLKKPGFTSDYIKLVLSRPSFSIKLFPGEHLEADSRGFTFAGYRSYPVQFELPVESQNLDAVIRHEFMHAFFALLSDPRLKGKESINYGESSKLSTPYPTDATPEAIEAFRDAINAGDHRLLKEYPALLQKSHAKTTSEEELKQLEAYKLALVEYEPATSYLYCDFREPSKTFTEFKGLPTSLPASEAPGGEKYVVTSISPKTDAGQTCQARRNEAWENAPRQVEADIKSINQGYIANMQNYLTAMKTHFIQVFKDHSQTPPNKPIEELSLDDLNFLASETFLSLHDKKQQDKSSQALTENETSLYNASIMLIKSVQRLRESATMVDAERMGHLAVLPQEALYAFYPEVMELVKHQVKATMVQIKESHSDSAQATKRVTP